ncbi:hypothetical protein B4096_3380 [Heyndrickxia coagulans]|nr:hypothetical protein B4096_3380 [Heyndrickxia coagulans]
MYRQSQSFEYAAHASLCLTLSLSRHSLPLFFSNMLKK